MKKIKLDLNKIGDRTIIGAFNTINGIKWSLVELSKAGIEAEEHAWKLVHKFYPELKGREGLSFDGDTKEIISEEEEGESNEN